METAGEDAGPGEDAVKVADADADTGTDADADPDTAPARRSMAARRR